ncbi:MAG: DUF4335 domain-containing protein [Leptolyngbya sp. UWPOB_LEPTO1]|uniref:DUF4335 domain-containing protein n=1 Tax=Leptolyngbya sp. UWPOB_LEPTO1 TaxID=2815653 RepID=UPI001ACEFEF5|nr:DUF4335 domain-containing protein [Leptolyngbya sp. UWPOB_LEPTO1]MBN8560936.1 DUF4335 domain-containing protein [Leptolyngbya sp. UWPOB_LEPTO1]
MSSPNSVIRRYTPPTCTLEIAAKDSPLSRWMGQSVLKHLRFKLSFDDPRVSEEQWTTIRGDRNQLEALCNAVSHYVQNFLSQSSRFGNRDSATATEPNTAVMPETEQNSAGIHLQPRGLISHELHLGTLANESTGSTLQLSAVQLADLASALDEYSADVTALPNLEKPSWVQVAPAWGTIAAGFIVAIGVMAAFRPLFDSSPAPQTAQSPSSNDQRLPVQPLPSTPAPNTIGALPTSPVPLPSGSPGTQTAPNLNPGSLPAQPGQPPQLRIAQEPAVEAPPQQQIQIQTPPLQDVPVASIPDQTKPSPAQGNTTGNQAARSRDPNEAPTPPENAGDAAIASAAREASPSAESAPQPSSLSRAAAPPAAVQIPQTKEAEQRLQKAWQPPADLKSNFEFVIFVDENGNITDRQPLDDTARKFANVAGIPKIGENLVSPLKGRGSATFRVLYKPDGTVQAFLQ